jgi:hypothetical protein
VIIIRLAPWGKRLALLLLFGLSGWLCLPLTPTVRAADGAALRLFGSAIPNTDRVVIPLGTITNGQLSSTAPLNVANDFTLEFWMRARAESNLAPDCTANGWYYGNIMIDRDVDGPGDYGDYGVALCAGRLVFGVSVAEDDRMAFGRTLVADDQWHHVAVTRQEGGDLTIFVNGQIDAQVAGPSGRIDYRLDRPSNRPSSDPYLVLGAEKHDYPGSFGYNGWFADLRISTTVRYTAAFDRPTAPHPLDADTVALYRFNEGSGTQISDATGLSAGVLLPRDPANLAEHWGVDSPFATLPVPLPADPAESPVPTLEQPAPAPVVTLMPVVQPSPVAPTALPAPTSVPPEPTDAPAPARSANEPPNPLTTEPPPGNDTQPVLVALLITGVSVGVVMLITYQWRRLRQ